MLSTRSFARKLSRSRTSTHHSWAPLSSSPITLGSLTHFKRPSSQTKHKNLTQHTPSMHAIYPGAPQQMRSKCLYNLDLALLIPSASTSLSSRLDLPSKQPPDGP